MKHGDRRLLAAVFAGGFIGAVARVELDTVLHVSSGGWPWPTFAVTSSAHSPGMSPRRREELPLSAYRRPVAGTGLCGALTTFSTMRVELIGMMDDGHVWLAVGYSAASIASGLAAVVAATKLVQGTSLSP